MSLLSWAWKIGKICASFLFWIWMCKKILSCSCSFPRLFGFSFHCFLQRMNWLCLCLGPDEVMFNAKWESRLSKCEEKLFTVGLKETKVFRFETTREKWRFVYDTNVQWWRKAMCVFSPFHFDFGGKIVFLKILKTWWIEFLLG